MYTDNATVTDLKNYFSRPVLIDTLNYNQTARGSMADYILSTFETKRRLKNFTRMQGVYGWRATFCFRMQAIATPFQAGRVRLSFYPFAGNVTYTRTQAITPVSQLPGVEMDLVETTSVILKVPFIFPRNYFTYEDQDSDTLGMVNIFAYTPVVLAAGAVSPKVAIWHWLEDVELIAAAPADTEIVLNAQQPAVAAAFVPYTGEPAVAQSGKFKSASSKEQDAVPGNLSNVLAAGSKLVTWMGTKIPLITSYSGPTSWMLREAAKIAASYGWAKPLAVAPVARMLQTVNTYQHNSDGTDTTYNLGGMTDNAIQPMSGFAGTDVDEMSFDYIKGVYAAISCGTLSTTAGVDALLYSASLVPSAMFFQNDNQNTIVPSDQRTGLRIWPSPICGIANPFVLWRGGFKFRIKMSKTKFHTGRLLFGFTPALPKVVLGAVVPTDFSSMEFKSSIWDLREGNVMEFEVPYIAPQPWCERYQSYGTFHISVIEPLQGPDTVAGTVPFVVEVAGASDMEFAWPDTPDFRPSPTIGNFVAQAGAFEPYAIETDTDQAANCIGEKYNSIKQLLSKACYTNVLINGHVTFRRPVSVPSFDTVGTVTSITGVDYSWRGYFDSWFGLERGGLCYHFTSVGKDLSMFSYLSDWAYPGSMVSSNSVLENSTGLHVKVPYYSPYSRNITGGVTERPTTMLNINISTSNSTQKCLVQQRCADDFQFGYFLGVPSMAKPSFPTTILDTLIDTATSNVREG